MTVAIHKDERFVAGSESEGPWVVKVKSIWVDEDGIAQIRIHETMQNKEETNTVTAEELQGMVERDLLVKQ